MQILAVIIRVTHIAFAVIAAGAAFYQFVAVRPALASLDDSTRKAVVGRMLDRWRPVVFAAMAMLLATGLMNFLIFRVPLYRGQPNAMVYHSLFGLKFLAALAAFHAATVLVLPGEKFDKYRARAGFWLSYLVAMFALIIVLGSVMNVMTQSALMAKGAQTPVTSAGGCPSHLVDPHAFGDRFQLSHCFLAAAELRPRSAECTTGTTA